MIHTQTIKKAFEQFRKFLEGKSSDDGGISYPLFKEMYGDDRKKLIEETDRYIDLILNYEFMYGPGDVVIVSVPSRCELIGNYQDYLPAGHTLSAGASPDSIGIAGRNEGEVKVYDVNFGPPFHFSINALYNPIDCPKEGWHPYIHGITSGIKEKFNEFSGIQMVIDGKIPSGSGSSSSAAFEVLVASLIDRVHRLNMNSEEIAFIAKKAENLFKGKNCGFLDQLSCALGGLVYINYEEELPVFEQISSRFFEGWHLMSVVVEWGINPKEEIDYNSIRSDLKSIASAAGMVTMAGNIKAYEQFIKGQLFSRAIGRGKFFVEEHERVKEAKNALQEGDAAAFGLLMDSSGDGSRDLLLNTNKIMDRAVIIARNSGGFARVHGNGQRGSIIIMTQYPKLIENVMKIEFPECLIINQKIRPGICEITTDRVKVD